jgi:hypothetical protein
VAEHFGRRLLLALLAVVVAGCGADGSEEASSATPRATPAKTAERPACPNPEGGACLGQLKAGTYRTTVFSPRITYRVPGGWQNFEDTPGNFLLVPPGQSLEGVNAGTSDFVGVYSAVAAAAQDCSEAPAPNVRETPAAIARWMTRLPGANATTPRPVKVGGLRGVVLDLSMAKGWKQTCSWAGDTPVVLLIVGVPPSSLTHGLIPGLAFRLYLLRHGNNTLAIEVDDVTGGHRLTRYATVAAQMRFAR